MADGLDPASILAGLGIAGVRSIAPVGGGMSGTPLWRVAADDGRDLLLRVFQGSDRDWVQREVDAQRAASAAGLPVPAVLAAGTVGKAGIPAMVSAWGPGRTIVEHLEAGRSIPPATAFRLGERSGTVLRGIHAVTPPDRLAHDADALRRRWLPDLPAWLIEAVDRPGASRHLLHFDFHPGNLLFEGTEVAAVIDWTNALVGDPLLDLGRTYACLQFGALDTPQYRDITDQFWRGIVTGYGLAAMTLEDLAPFLAVGLTTLIDDLRRVGGRIDQALVDELEVERDAWLGMVRRDG